MTDFRNNHYVPQWYQERFVPANAAQRKFYYLDLHPDTVRSGSRTYRRAALLRWGPKRCFRERDLYTTRFGSWTSTEIEQVFFGAVDREGRSAVEYFDGFRHPSVDGDAFNRMVLFMSLQKLRTPKGMAELKSTLQQDDKNALLFAVQSLQQMYCATWAECNWSIADASRSRVKFIVSDHPVTVYNSACFPASEYCRGSKDPDIRLTGTHTVFPLSADKVLILTNVSWIRNPYSSPLRMRPNPNLFRSAVFNFMQIQTGRQLAEAEVIELNYIIKSRAYRYIAAWEEEWLFPERHLQTQHWDRLGGGYLLMPDPRDVAFTSGIVIGYGDGRRDAYDQYGRRPGQPGFQTEDRTEWDAHLAFQGEFARVFGPRRRGTAYEHGRPSPERDEDDFHAYHLRLERLKPRKKAVRRYPQYVSRPAGDDGAD